MTEKERLSAEREQRFNDIVALKRPDRVPVIPLVNHYFGTKVKGISNADAGYDSRVRYRSMREATVEFGWDMCPPNGVFPSKGLEAPGTLQLRWPGGALAEDAPFQFVEGEYVREEEYDEFLGNSNAFTLTKILPRIFSKLEGLGQVPFPPLYWLSNSYSFNRVGGALFSTSPMRTILESLLELADAWEEEDAIVADHLAKLNELGLPLLSAAVVFPAFDMVSDFFRGPKGGSLDIYRNPDKLQKAIDLMQPVVLGSAMAMVQGSGNKRVFIPMHRVRTTS